MFSIKKVLTANCYLIKTYRDGVKILTIENLEAQKFSLKLFLEVDKEDFSTQTDSIQLQVAQSDIVIATTINQRVGDRKYKRSLKVMKVKIANT